MNLTITPQATDELKKAVAEQQEGTGLNMVRVLVQSQCGCGNAHFAMGFDEPEEDDSRIDLDGVTLLVDPYTAPLLDGAEMVYLESDNLTQRGFKINTANKGGGCGCGGGGHHHH
jgi:iron-sulfur cluster assembly accessory protein